MKCSMQPVLTILRTSQVLWLVLVWMPFSHGGTGLSSQNDLFVYRRLINVLGKYLVAKVGHHSQFKSATATLLSVRLLPRGRLVRVCSAVVSACLDSNFCFIFDNNQNSYILFINYQIYLLSDNWQLVYQIGILGISRIHMLKPK